MTTHFESNLFHTIEVGHLFAIRGKTIDGANRLDINIKSSKYEYAPIPLQISIRFDENIIVRSSYDSGEWQPEERHENLSNPTVLNPIASGDFFKVYILVGDLCFHISINGQPYCTYLFRLPLSEIRTIIIDKDLQSINQFDHRCAFPTPYPAIQIDSGDNPTLLFSNDVPKQFKPGHVIIIKAIPYGNTKGRFAITFTENGTAKEALHFNPRFDPHFVVVRNAMNDNLEFGMEERDGRFPFILDEQFKLAIALTDTEFRFGINSYYFGSFKYRTENQLDNLNGFKMFSSTGIMLEVFSVDHLNMGISNCDGFEAYTNADIQLF